MATLNQIEWNGHTIEFIPVLSHKTFWVATLNELKFDGKRVATSGGFCFSCQARASVAHDGRPVAIVLRSSLRFGFNLNYELLIDGRSVSRGVAKILLRW